MSDPRITGSSPNIVPQSQRDEGDLVPALISCKKHHLKLQQAQVSAPWQVPARAMPCRHCTATGKIQQWQGGTKLLQAVQECGLACFPMVGLRRRSPSLRIERRFRELGLLSLVKRKLWGFFIAAFQYLKGAYKKYWDRYFGRAFCNRTKINDLN